MIHHIVQHRHRVAKEGMSVLTRRLKNPGDFGAFKLACSSVAKAATGCFTDDVEDVLLLGIYNPNTHISALCPPRETNEN